MENEERMQARANLDKELRYFKIAAKKASNYPKWLRRVRQVLGVRATEIARKLEVNTSVIFRLEKSEDSKSISLKALEKMAAAMDCKLVYAVVPRRGESLMELAEMTRWVRKLGK
jgi:transcriptional regulator with XRE-family HTH domain